MKTLSSFQLPGLNSLPRPFCALVRDRPCVTVDGVYGNPNSYPYRARQRRFEIIKPMIERIIEAKGVCRIADVGGTEYYWNIARDFVERSNVEIHLLNMEPQCPINRDKFIGYPMSAGDLGQFGDRSFDMVHSNSVIEHVGGWAQMKDMSAQVRRLAPSYYVQTPNFWFPVEPHFRAPMFHFLPEQLRYRALMSLNLGFGGKRRSVDDAMQAVQSASLLDHRQMQTLFPDADIRFEKFGPLTKSLMAIREVR